MLVTSLVPNVVSESSDNASNKIYTSVQVKYQEESMKKTISKYTQGHKSDCDYSSLNLALLLFQQSIDLLRKIMVQLTGEPYMRRSLSYFWRRQNFH